MRTLPSIVITLLCMLPLLAAPAAGVEYPLNQPSRIYNLVMLGTSFNGMHYPSTPLLEAYVGERVMFNIIVPAGVAESHTFHLHGHPWFVPEDERMVDTILVQPGDVHTFRLNAGSLDHEAGDWMYHCHIDSHMALGMWGIFRVYAYAVHARPLGGALDVTLDRMGEPVAGATFTADGANVHSVETAPGHYLVHAGASVAVLTAHSALGESVARLTDAPATLDAAAGAGPHVH